MTGTCGKLESIRAGLQPSSTSEHKCGIQMLHDTNTVSQTVNHKPFPRAWMRLQGSRCLVTQGSLCSKHAHCTGAALRVSECQYPNGAPAHEEDDLQQQRRVLSHLPVQHRHHVVVLGDRCLRHKRSRVTTEQCLTTYITLCWLHRGVSWFRWNGLGIKR